MSSRGQPFRGQAVSRFRARFRGRGSEDSILFPLTLPSPHWGEGNFREGVWAEGK